MACHPPVASPVRIILEAELHMLIIYYLFGIPAGSLKCETDEEWVELEIDRRTTEPVYQIRVWGLHDERRAVKSGWRMLYWPF
jgi:hypothetical protein